MKEKCCGAMKRFLRLICARSGTSRTTKTYFYLDGDRSIDDDGRVRLKKDGVERIRSGEPKDETVDIILNGEMISVDKGRLTFGELARLAFPDLFGRDQICFTVSFSRGPKRRREGVLLEGGKVRVVVGMVFNVSATDKS